MESCAEWANSGDNAHNADRADWADRDQTFKRVLKLKVFLITDLVTGSS